MDYPVLEKLLQNSAWIGVAGTLVGGLLVGMFALISKWIDKSSESKNLIRIKLEELHIAVSRYLIFVLSFRSEIDNADEFAGTPDGGLNTAAKNEFIAPLGEMTTLSRLYAREVVECFDNLENLVEEFFDADNAFACDPNLEFKGELLVKYGALAAGVREAQGAVEDSILRRGLTKQGFLESWRAVSRFLRRKEEKKDVRKSRNDDGMTELHREEQ